MKIIGFEAKDIFLKGKSCLLDKKPLSGILCLKNGVSIKSGNTIIFYKNNSTIFKIIFKVLFIFTLTASTLILCLSAAVFNFKEIQALPLSPLAAPLQGEFVVKFRQEYFDEVEMVMRKHTGVDITGRPGDKVRASGNGIVSYTGFSAIGGRTIVIKHNDKIRSTYLNILDCFVTAGDQLSQGDIIGSIGAYDDPSFKEPHLHFGIIYMDSYLNPEDIFSIEYASISRFISLEYINPDFRVQFDWK